MVKVAKVLHQLDNVAHLPSRGRHGAADALQDVPALGEDRALFRIGRKFAGRPQQLPHRLRHILKAVDDGAVNQLVIPCLLVGPVNADAVEGLAVHIQIVLIHGDFVGLGLHDGV